jgi:hypothetical protein
MKKKDERIMTDYSEEQEYAEKPEPEVKENTGPIDQELIKSREKAHQEKIRR